MKVEELVDRLTQFGLGQREALTYYHLHRLGPSKASEVVQATGLQRTETYRVLDDLASKGAIDRTLERPQRFIARPLEEVLELAMEERRTELEELAGQRPAIQEAWPRGGAAEIDEEVRFSVVEGRTQVQGLLERMVEKAQDEVYVVALRRGLSRLEHLGLLDVLEAQRDDGVLVRVLTDVTDANLETVQRWAKVCEVRHGDLPGYHQSVIVDTRDIALFVTVDPLVSVESKGEETVLNLNARDFILGQKGLADAMWDRALDLEARLEELETGDPAEQVEVVRGRWTRYSRMKDMLYRAKDLVHLLVGPAEAERLQKAGLAHLLQRRAGEGLEVRLHVTGETDTQIPGVERRQGPVDTLPGAVMLVDDQEALAVLDAHGEPGSVTHAGDWATWVTVDHEVQRLAGSLDEAWSSAKKG